MKLIIEIDEDDYTMCQILAKEMCDTRMKLTDNLKYAISNGIPLDKIKDEIERMDYLDIEDGSDGYDNYVDRYDVLQIIDKYEAERSEE